MRRSSSLNFPEQNYLRKLTPGTSMGSALSAPIESRSITNGLAVVDLSPVLGGSHYNLHVSSNPSVLFNSESEALLGKSLEPSKLIERSKSHNFLSKLICRKEQSILQAQEGMCILESDFFLIFLGTFIGYFFAFSWDEYW